MRKTKTAIRASFIKTNSEKLMKKFKSGSLNKVEKAVATAILSNRGLI